MNFTIQDEPRHAKDLTKSEQRALVLHMLYTMEMNDNQISLEAMAYQYDCAFRLIIESDDQVFQDVEGVIKYAKTADSLIKPLLQHWKMERMSVITHLILQYALWELNVKHGDAALVINEAVELAKGFGEADSYRFINGVLDSWIKQERDALPVL